MDNTTDIINTNKIFLWIAAGTAVILSIPLIAMQFTNEVQWTLFDFLIMGILLFGMGSLYVAIARVIPNNFRLLVGIICFIALFAIWAHLAVGIVDTWPLAGS